MNKNEISILAYIDIKSKVNAKEISLYLSLDKAIVYKALKNLKEQKLVKIIGQNPKSYIKNEEKFKKFIFK